MPARDKIHDILDDILSRLSVFEIRFGTPPREWREWKTLEAAGRQALPAFETHWKCHGDTFDITAAKSYCLLLVLGGRGNDAVGLLESLRPGGGCGNFRVSVDMHLLNDKSIVYQLMDRHDKSLEAMQIS